MDDEQLPADLSAQLFVQLYGKLATALSLRGLVGDDSGAILSLDLPGLYIRPGLDPTDPETQYYVANALNATLACSWLVTRGAATVTDVYKSILDGKEAPLVSLTPGQREALDAARAYLFQGDGEPTPAYAEYLALQLVYLEALDGYEAARATADNGGLPVPPELRERLDACDRRWREDGHKSAVEQALATIALLEGLEPERFWAGLSARFADYTLSAGIVSHYQYVASNPPYGAWFEPLGWSDFSFDDLDFRNQARTGGSGFGAGGECCCRGAGGVVPGRFPPPSAPAVLASHRDGDAQETPIALGDLVFRLKARLRRVEIVRPWLDANVFHSRAWRWSPASIGYGSVISTGGDVAGGLVPDGLMTVLPGTAVLASDVDIVWEDGGRTLGLIGERLDAGHEVRFGPFRLTRAAIEGGHIAVAGPQLIGFISTILPQCPNPDPLLPWPRTEARRDSWPI